jgi:hypothetical protein
MFFGFSLVSQMSSGEETWTNDTTNELALLGLV